MSSTELALQSASAYPELYHPKWPARLSPPAHHQLREHPHPHPQRRVGEVIPIAVQRRIRIPLRRLNADQEETPRNLLQVIGEILPAHRRSRDHVKPVRSELLPGDLGDVLGHGRVITRRRIAFHPVEPHLAII